MVKYCLSGDMHIMKDVSDMKFEYGFHLRPVLAIGYCLRVSVRVSINHELARMTTH